MAQNKNQKFGTALAIIGGIGGAIGAILSIKGDNQAKEQAINDAKMEVTSYGKTAVDNAVNKFKSDYLGERFDRDDVPRRDD